MTIHLQKENNATILICDSCQTQTQTDNANGVVPSDWLTGQLWIDVSLSNQKQIPICFCPTCSINILNDNRILVVSTPIEEIE